MGIWDIYDSNHQEAQHALFFDLQDVAGCCTTFKIVVRIVVQKNELRISTMWVEEFHKPPIGEWCKPPINMVIWGIVDDLVLATFMAILMVIYLVTKM